MYWGEINTPFVVYLVLTSCKMLQEIWQFHWVLWCFVNIKCPRMSLSYWLTLHPRTYFDILSFFCNPFFLETYFTPEIKYYIVIIINTFLTVALKTTIYSFDHQSQQLSLPLTNDPYVLKKGRNVEKTFRFQWDFEKFFSNVHVSSSSLFCLSS